MRRSTVNRDIRFVTVTLKIILFCVKFLARQHERCEAFWLRPLSVFMCSHNNHFSTQLNRLVCLGEVHIIAGHEVPEGKSRRIVLLFRRQIEGWLVKASPRLLYPRGALGTHFIGGLVGPKAGLDMDLSCIK